jgi:excisionase family DNA binding protein
MRNTIIQKLERIEELLANQTIKPFTFREAYNYLGVSSSYLYKLTSTGQIRHYKPSGKLIYFEKKDLDCWLLKHPVKSIEEIENISATHVLLNHKIRLGKTTYSINNKIIKEA